MTRQHLGWHAEFGKEFTACIRCGEDRNLRPAGTQGMIEQLSAHQMSPCVGRGHQQDVRR